MNFMKELKDIGLVEWDNTQSDQNPFHNGTAAMTILNENEFNSINTGDLEGKLNGTNVFRKKTVLLSVVCTYVHECELKTERRCMGIDEIYVQ